MPKKDSGVLVDILHIIGAYTLLFSLSLSLSLCY